ncbi:Hint domain-containing protein [Leptospira stimsonii]|uniref:Hint domain-containing protein n=1 Tax=Leptospira stimsonii TaxID=2202203 RepID=UPI0014383C39|nr:Hint domain-containing protein [Leptospira stimsonii]
MSYNSDNGFSHSLAQQANGWDSIIASNQSSLMSHMEETNKNVAAVAYEMDQAKKAALISASKNPGSEISQSDLDNWANLSEDDKEKLVQKHLSGNTSGKHDTRSGAWNQVKGVFEDYSNQLSGNFSDDSGWMEDVKDKDGNVIGKKFVNRTCFVAGTPVHTKDGLKKIEEIQVGDVVLSWDEELRAMTTNKVTTLWLRETELLYEIEIGSDKLRTTWNHPFWLVTKNAWVETKDLKVGDIILRKDGKSDAIRFISSDDVELTQVYNFEVENTHTYFVGEEGFLVHNQSKNGIYPSSDKNTKNSNNRYNRIQANKAQKNADSLSNANDAWLSNANQKVLKDLEDELGGFGRTLLNKKLDRMVKDGQFDKSIGEQLGVDFDDFDGSKEELDILNDKANDMFEKNYNDTNLSVGHWGH